MARDLWFDALAESDPVRAVTALETAVQGMARALDTAAAAGGRAGGMLQRLGRLAENACTGARQLLGVFSGKGLAEAGRDADGAAASVRAIGKAAATTARQATRAVRSLASFDEIERLAAPAAAGTAGESAGSAGKNAGAARKETTDAPDLTALQAMLEAARIAVADFWEKLRALYAPAIEAWQSAWGQMQAAALAVWGPVSAAAGRLWQGTLAPLLGYLGGVFAPGLVNSFSAAFAPIAGGAVATAVAALGDVFVWLAGVAGQFVHGVLQPALALALQIWQGLMAAVEAAWQNYGAPVLAGVREGVQNLIGILDTLWTGAVQPLLQNLIAGIGALWEGALSPLFGALTQAVGAVINLLLALWNEVLAPLLNFAVASFGPLLARVFETAAAAVGVAVGVMAGLLETLLELLRGLADFLTSVLLGDWQAGWQRMQAAVAEAWQTITATVRGAVDGLGGLVNGFISGILDAVESALAALRRLGGASAAAGGALGRRSRAAYSAAPTLAAAPLRVPALAAGAVIPPNRAFLALLGDQRQGVNIEAPLDTIRQAFAETLANYLGEDSGQPINIYIGDELLDTVVARSQRRRSLRTGGR